MALVPFLGAAAQYLFGLGLLSVSILAAGVLPLATAYVVCEAFGFESGLDNSFREAPVFNGLITVPHVRAGRGRHHPRPAAGQGDPASPSRSTASCCRSSSSSRCSIINDPRVMGEHVNGRVRNVIAWGFTVALIGMSAVLLLSPLFT